MAKDPDLDKWERRENESDQAFEAFENYRTAGLQRSLANSAKAINKSLTLLEGWSAKHEWRIRTNEWDRHVAREINRQLVSGAAEARKRHANNAANIAVQASKRILRMTDAEIAAISPRDAAYIMKMAADTEIAMRSVADDQTVTTPFQVVVNVIEQRSELEEVLVYAAERAAEEAKEEQINVIQ